jgi:hypothetical protein
VNQDIVLVELIRSFRLKVPKVRAILEYFNFIILFILYVMALEGLNQKKINVRESLFIIYAMGESRQTKFLATQLSLSFRYQVSRWTNSQLCGNTV